MVIKNQKKNLYYWEAQLHPKNTVRTPVFPSFLFLMGKAKLVDLFLESETNLT